MSAKSRRSVTLSLVLGLGLAACGEPGRGPSPSAPPFSVIDAPRTTALASVTLKGVAHVEQRPDFCGEACVEMAGSYFGKRWDQDRVFALAGIDPALGRGAVTPDLVRALERLGFDVGDVWHTIPAADPGPALERELEAMHADLSRGVPTIVCMHYSSAPSTTEHFRLVVGYDAASDEILYQEPAEAAGGYRRMARAELLSLWPLKYDEAKWSVIRIPLVPKHLVDAPAAATEPSPADLAQHVMALRRRLPPGFGVLVDAPFVVVGRGPREALAEHGGSTVAWAKSLLAKDFFERAPRTILDVWLYPDRESYGRGVAALTGDVPDTPYGFYSPANHGLFMNIATGGGTLVHELVHPYVEADFPEAPPWINEGLGSLFEQSGERDGHIVGYTNWRLEGLQKAIRRHGVPALEALSHMSSSEFYGEGEGTNYAAARYLLYYLQEHGLLRAFYRAARDGAARDPSGYRALVDTLGERDMRAFQARWETYVLGLTFP